LTYSKSHRGNCAAENYQTSEQYRLKVKFVAPELLLQAFGANEKVSRFGIRRIGTSILDDIASRQLLQARDLARKKYCRAGPQQSEISIRT